MKTRLLMGAGCAVLAVLASPARSESDACSLVTQAAVSAAVGFPVVAGTHVTPAFVKTCTWKGTSGGGAQFVTLNLQTAAFYDGGKKQTAMMGAAGAVMKPAGVGDDSYFLVEGTLVMLWVKKGANAFKVAIYKQMPVDQKEAMEQALAKQVAAKL